MGGGGGGYEARDPQTVRRALEEAKEQALKEGFGVELQDFLGRLLGEINQRDSEKISQRIQDIKQFLSDELDQTIDPIFGGSVAKHTYVDGLSDIDSLFVFKADTIQHSSPAELIDECAKLISAKLKIRADVTAGAMATTIKFPDGMELQILPAVKNADGVVSVASASGERWSAIAPVKFQNILTKRNQECSGKLVPTIKLAKAINSTLPEQQRLTGYHIESIAVDAFRGYSGVKSTSAMITEFFSKAKNVVLSPIRDRSGQSVHVDDYLGPAHSPSRLRQYAVLDRVEKRLSNATRASSISLWKAAFGLDSE